MEKTIAVQFHINGIDLPIQVVYSIQMEKNIQTISCSVQRTENSNWLQLGKFELKSQYDNGIYVALFNEALNKKNMATSLFIDQVYDDIMGREKMRVYKEEAS